MQESAVLAEAAGGSGAGALMYRFLPHFEKLCFGGHRAEPEQETP